MKWDSGDSSHWHNPLRLTFPLMVVVVVLHVSLLPDVAGGQSRSVDWPCHGSGMSFLLWILLPRQHSLAIGRQSVAYHTTQSFSASEQLCIWCMSSRFTTGITLQSAISPLVMHRCLQREFTMLLCWMDSGCTCLMCPGGATIEVSIVVALVMRCQSSYGFVYCICITF